MARRGIRTIGSVSPAARAAFLRDLGGRGEAADAYADAGLLAGGETARQRLREQEARARSSA
jgi:predicted RNA polymerase sigma factor